MTKPDINTNEGLEAYVLSMLPTTYGRIVATLPDGQHGPHYRKVDQAIQRLRKRGRIAFKRIGNQTFWSEVAHDAD